MKTFFIIALFLLFGCGHTGSKKFNNNKVADSSAHGLAKKKKASNEDRLSYFTYQKKEDSIPLASMMKDILSYANKRENAKSYFKKLDIWNLKNSTYPYSRSAVLTFGHLFSNTKKHLIVRRTVAGSIVFVDVFLLNNSKFQLVCSQLLDAMTYLNDTIKDVNGDYQKDFLIHWYPSAGCCRRNIYDVYLYQENYGDFTKKYEFINPTFSPSEKIIRGVGYGHSGEVELYKYEWNGLKVDTIEFIFPDTLTKKFHTYKHENDFDNPKAGKYLTSVPKEYHKIESYDWFEGDY